MYVCMYACMHACMYVCMYACMYACIMYATSATHTNIHIYKPVAGDVASVVNDDDAHSLRAENSQNSGASLLVLVYLKGSRLVRIST